MRSGLELLAVVVVLLAGCTAPAVRGPAEDKPDERADSELVVYAASSLTEAFEAIAPLYERGGGKVRFSFESSSTLASQIVEGAPADVFASADRLQMAVVQGEGLAVNPEPFATNRLVVIAPEENPRGVERPQDLAQDGLKLVLAGPEVPAGVYAREMLRRLGVVERAEANVVSNEEDVKAVVSKVRLGEADAGVVYRTDVTSEVADDLHVIEVPPPTSPLAVYPIAALTQAPNPAGAQEFVDLVASKAGARVLRRFGFGLR